MRYLLLLCSLLALQAAPTLAQNALPTCNGEIAIVRVSEVKPGAMKDFMDGWPRIKHGIKTTV